MIAGKKRFWLSTKHIGLLPSIHYLVRVGLTNCYNSKLCTFLCIPYLQLVPELCPSQGQLYYREHYYITGPPTIVDVNINIRSMGPISEQEMVSSMKLWVRKPMYFFFKLCSRILFAFMNDSLIWSQYSQLEIFWTLNSSPLLKSCNIWYRSGSGRKTGYAETVNPFKSNTKKRKTPIWYKGPYLHTRMHAYRTPSLKLQTSIFYHPSQW